MNGFQLAGECQLKPEKGIEASFYFFKRVHNWFNGGKLKTYTVRRGTKSAIDAFKDYENGQKVLYTKDPKGLHMALRGKAAWGLWANEYAHGVANFLTTWEEIKEIGIPNKFLIEVYNKAKNIRYAK